MDGLLLARSFCGMSPCGTCRGRCRVSGNHDSVRAGRGRHKGKVDACRSRRPHHVVQSLTRCVSDSTAELGSIAYHLVDPASVSVSPSRVHEEADGAADPEGRKTDSTRGASSDCQRFGFEAGGGTSNDGLPLWRLQPGVRGTHNIVSTRLTPLQRVGSCVCSQGGIQRDDSVVREGSSDEALHLRLCSPIGGHQVGGACRLASPASPPPTCSPSQASQLATNSTILLHGSGKELISLTFGGSLFATIVNSTVKHDNKVDAGKVPDGIGFAQGNDCRQVGEL
mmetsp:Transcript_6645/g.21502  ORF Transcript_6645/g.21502 Transcript_6645/m.21502 type:complete len:282 (-) Transcript_6645:3363-4208(-)